MSIAGNGGFAVRHLAIDQVIPNSWKECQLETSCNADK
jgi:hypothetical protein